LRILNFGSLNIDHVYKVDNFVRPGETISAKGYSIFCGGKGLNQSIAAAKAGAEVFHAGKVGRDGFKLIEKLKSFGVDISRVQIGDDPTGHAIIQVDSKENISHNRRCNNSPIVNR
jgi:ribokinase